MGRGAYKLPSASKEHHGRPAGGGRQMTENVLLFWEFEKPAEDRATERVRRWAVSLCSLEEKTSAGWFKSVFSWGKY